MVHLPSNSWTHTDKNRKIDKNLTTKDSSCEYVYNYSGNLIVKVRIVHCTQSKHYNALFVLYIHSIHSRRETFDNFV